MEDPNPHWRQAADEETDQLIKWLRNRCAALHAALLDTAQELADTRKRLDAGAAATENSD